MSYPLDNAALELHARHILLEEIGTTGQEKLAKAKVTLIGLGGLGCPAAMYLASAGIGELVLVDDDNIETSNLQRQLLFRQNDVGNAKVATAASILTEINPHINITTVAQRVQVANIDEIISASDIVIDATDNFPTRHLINATCQQAKVNLVSGAAEQFDGQVMVFAFAKQSQPCYACLYPPTDTNAEPTPCSQLGVFAPLTGIIGSLMATEAIRLLCLPSTGLTAKLFAYDVAEQRVAQIAISAANNCPVCSS